MFSKQSFIFICLSLLFFIHPQTGLSAQLSSASIGTHQSSPFLDKSVMATCRFSKVTAVVEVCETENMLQILFVGDKLQSLNQFHEEISEALHLPIWYGKNLDALLDVMTDKSIVTKKVDLILIHGDSLALNIGQISFQNLVSTFADIEERNSDFSYEVFQ